VRGADGECRVAPLPPGALLAPAGRAAQQLAGASKTAVSSADSWPSSRDRPAALAESPTLSSCGGRLDRHGFDSFGWGRGRWLRPPNPLEMPAARRRRPGCARCAAISQSFMVTSCRGKEWRRDSWLTHPPHLPRLERGCLAHLDFDHEPGLRSDRRHSETVHPAPLGVDDLAATRMPLGRGRGRSTA